MILTLDGGRFDNIPGFYDEVNRVFMSDESWHLGESLDALDDMLHGGYGALKNIDFATLRWLQFEKSRRDLGHDATRSWLQAKLDRPGFNHQRVSEQLAALAKGKEPTYFDIIQRIIAEHPNIRLVEM